MNTQIIAIANQKGGVGKTTTCANLGIGLAQAGKKVLLIDGDPQGSLTISLGNPQPDKLPFTLSDAMGKILMDQPIRPGEGILHHAEGVDLMPADIQLSGMEVSLVNAMSRETILRQYLDTLKGQYSHILIDCQPSLGMLTVNALAAANRIIIPVQAEYEPTPFLVDELIPEGLHILAGAPKIGKSWLALWLCLCVSQGQPLWNFATTQGEVLYLSLEDSFQRIQTRLFDLTEDAPPTLHFAIMANTLRHGLEQQIEQFLSEHPATKLVVIDTLQRVRSAGSDSNLYANDYQDIGLLKRLADRRHIAILLIHHLRKLHDDDPMNMISGSTGLSGAADSTFVLQKSSRLANIATLHCTGRDIPDRTLKLEFGEEDHVWKLLEDSKTCSTTSKISALQIENLLSELLQKEPEISAPAKALLEKIDPAGIEGWTPNSFSHQIRKSVDTLRQNGIFISFRKSNGERLICLKRVDGADLPTVEKIVPIDPAGVASARTAP